LKGVIESKAKTTRGEESRWKKRLQSVFEGIEDTRMDRTKLHQLEDIILIAILAVICGAEGWVDIEAFGKVKEE